MLTRKLGPAIAAGCATIVKPAEATPLTAVAICRVLVDCGMPSGTVNLVTSSRPEMVADVLFSDPRVRKISFTGSTEVGKKLIRWSADHVQRLSLELGGHAPFIVFDDADVDDAVDQQALVKVERHVDDAIRRGARVRTGGTRITSGDLALGNFFAPTILEGIAPDMLLSTEETFGPVVGVSSFATEIEVIRAANATPYGLAAYAQTRDYGRIFRLADQLDFGVIGINDGAPSNPAAPFGGMKASGFGREGGAAGIDEYVNVKFVSIGGVHQKGTDARR
jgi:succinate-semialdehyde dehydrogenase/glutarate-semialdehyde dehydrogenase